MYDFVSVNHLTICLRNSEISVENNSVCHVTGKHDGAWDTQRNLGRDNSFLIIYQNRNLKEENKNGRQSNKYLV